MGLTSWAAVRWPNLRVSSGSMCYEQAIQTRVITAATVQTPSMIIPPLMCAFLQHSKLGSSAAKVRAPASQRFCTSPG